MESPIEINIEPLFPDFKKHLDIKNNTRVLFSAPFGMGKTYFLRKFFNSFKDSYGKVVRLRPSRYQVTANESVVDYVLLDIYRQVAGGESVDSSQQKSGQEVAEIAGSNLEKARIGINKVRGTRWYDIVTKMVGVIPGAGPLFQGALDIIGEFGVITESDIKKCLDEEKPNVLIIDDLDRLDPQHIFRIINLLLHDDNDDAEDGMLFGFEKVILVADYNELKKIFRHWHGEGSRHEGYFDKFFNVAPYEYDNDENVRIILGQIDEIVSSFNVSEDIKEYFTEGMRSGYFVYLIYRTLQIGFHLKDARLNLRVLFKAVKYEIPVLSEMQVNPVYVAGFDVVSRSDQIEMLNNSINALKVLLGDKESLIECVRNIADARRDGVEVADEMRTVNSTFGGLIFKVLHDKGLSECSSVGNEDKKVYIPSENSSLTGCPNFVLKVHNQCHLCLLTEAGKKDFDADALQTAVNIYRKRSRK